MEEAEAPSSHFAVFSVLSQVLEKDEISAQEFEEKDRPKDDYIDHELLREWFRKRLKVADEHKMSLREIWRNFCYEYQIYCSLPLFGNVVLRHVLQANSKWKGVTKVGDIKQKRYNLAWISDPPGTEEQIDAFFARIKEKVDRAPRAHANGSSSVPSSLPDPTNVPPSLNSISPSGNIQINSPSVGVNVTSSVGGSRLPVAHSAAIEVPHPATSPPLASSFGSTSPFGDGDLSPDEGGSGSGVFGRNSNVPQVFLDPSLLADWWTRRLEPTDPGACRMRMRDIYERFVLETGVAMPKALFGELSVRYVLSTGPFAQVVRKGKIHSKRYSLQWRNEPFYNAAHSSNGSVSPIPTSNSAPLLNNNGNGNGASHVSPSSSMPTPIPQVNSSGSTYGAQRFYDAPSRGSPPVRHGGNGSNANSPSTSGFSASFSLYHQHQLQPIGRPAYAAAVMGNAQHGHHINNDSTRTQTPDGFSGYGAALSSGRSGTTYAGSPARKPSLPAQPAAAQWPPPPQQSALQPKQQQHQHQPQAPAQQTPAPQPSDLATGPQAPAQPKQEGEGEGDSYALNHYRSPNVLAQCTA